MPNSYTAPLKDIRFVLRHLIGDATLASFAEFSGYSEDFADSVLDAAAGFAQDVLAPINAIGDRSPPQWTAQGVAMAPAFKAAYARYAADGWSQLRGPAAYGGQAAPKVLSTAVEELWASANLAFRLCPMLTAGAVEAILYAGTEAQKRLYLPRLVSGEWTGTMNLTEAQAGTDLGSIRTRATQDGSQYRVFGQKIFITYGEHDYTPNIIHLVLARIDGAPEGTRGISLFIVPKVLVNDDGSLGAPNDVRCTSIERKLGIHASPTCVMSYGDAGGAVGYLVGEANRGLEYMFVMMNAARLSVGLEGYALAERAYQQALGWAQERVQGRPAAVPSERRTIDCHGDVRRMLLTMRSGVEAARALALYAAFQLDSGAAAPDPLRRTRAQARGELLIPIVKGGSTELGVTLASLGVQIHGGMGFIEDTGAAQYLRDARIGPIYEGTTGIQALDLVGRKVVRDRGGTMFELIAELRQELVGTVPGEAEAFDAAAPALAALDTLDRATVSVLDAAARGPAHAQAVAVPFLLLSWLVLAAALLAKSHAIAARLAASDPEFLAAKQRSARFFLTHSLAAAEGLARVVAEGADCVVEDVLRG